MNNLDIAKMEFDKYTKKFDLNMKELEGKYYHTYRVMELCGKIAESLNLNEKEVEIAKIIGLLHDIGRFKQFTKYITFSDINSIDHAILGVEILEKDEYLRHFIKENNYDKIILKAIENHNKLDIESGLTDEEMLFCKIIRDADKIDIMYESTDFFYKENNELQKIENSIITDEMVEEIKKEKLIEKKPDNNELDGLLICLCFVFDLNFKYSIKNIFERDLINKIINRFNFSDKCTQENIEKIRVILNNFIRNE